MEAPEQSTLALSSPGNVKQIILELLVHICSYLEQTTRRMLFILFPGALLRPLGLDMSD